VATICPTVLAGEPHEFREQMERIAGFGNRVQIDLTDGLFTFTKTVPLEQVWWPHGLKADLHLMYKRPDLYLKQLLDLEPSMVIIHAEAEGKFEPFAEALHEAGIRVGVALLQDTKPELIEPALEMIDHVLIFSGDLGRFGGAAQLKLLGKILKLKHWKPELEIGWDGGINDKNAKQLAKGGVDVLNVGGFIQNAKDPEAAYRALKKLVKPGQKV
jgi:ribulose-phosphate 3-epimerase